MKKEYLSDRNSLFWLAGIVGVSWMVLLLFGGVPKTFAQAAAENQAGDSRSKSGTAQSNMNSQGDRINESQLAGLPLNGRSYSQLATLQAGVSDPTAASGSRGVGGGGLTVSGGRSTSNNFLLDGTNIMNTDNQVPRSAAGVQLGSDAVLQVQVFSTQYGAEYGRGSGGVLNSITRSGTPEFHASLFEFFRNSKLDARNFFDPGSSPTPFKRNQFGFTVTGPLRKDRTYFMGSLEALRDRLSETVVDFFPDAPARAGAIVPVYPSVRPYLDFYPMPNAGSLPGGVGIGENRSSQHLPTNESFFTIRLDHQFADRDSLFVRYTFDDATSQTGDGNFLFSTLSNSRQQYLTLVASHIFSASAVNSIRLGYTRPVVYKESLSAIAIPRSLYFLADAPQFGVINVPGLSSFGPNFSNPDDKIMNSFQFADDLVIQRGAHALKMGVQVHRYRWDVVGNWTRSGVWSFNSLLSFLQGGPGGTSLEVALPGSDNTQAYRQTSAGFYAQDTYGLRPNLQLDLGVRYEFSTMIQDARGKSVYMLDVLRDPEVQMGPLFQNNPSRLNFSPRLGLTWSPGRDRTTIFRAGFGIYYDQILEYLVHQRRSSAPFFKRAVKTNFNATNPATPFPNAVLTATGVPLHVQTMDYRNTSSPRVLRYNFGIERDLPGNWQVQAAYVGARANHLFRTYETNLFPIPQIRSEGSLFFPPDEKLRPANPAFGSINFSSSDAQSFYNSLQLSASKRLGAGLSLQGSYTYGKSVDDFSTHMTGESSIQYGFLRTLERSLSDFDIRHRLVVNYFYTLPWGSGQRWWTSGVPSQLLGGWRVGGILSFRTGVPSTPAVRLRYPNYLFEPARPNLMAGGSKNPVEGVSAGCLDEVTRQEVVRAGQELGTQQLYFDPCVYTAPPAGTLGNAGRNTIIGPSVFSLDVSLQREFALDSKRRFQFRADFFNLPNHTNFNRPSGGSTTIFAGTAGRRVPTAGRLVSTATTARQIQFSLRFSF